MKFVIPLAPTWFKKKRIYRSKAYFETRLQETLDQHPDLQEVGYLTVGVARDRGLLKPEVHLFGEVEYERLRALAIEIASAVGQGVIEVVNEIIVVEKLKSKRT